MIPWREYIAKVREQYLGDIGKPPMKYTIAGRAGDIAKCVNGHHLYRLLSDVMPHTVIQSSMFDPIGDSPRPLSGQPIQPCHICGLPWVVLNPNGGTGFVFANLEQKF